MTTHRSLLLLVAGSVLISGCAAPQAQVGDFSRAVTEVTTVCSKAWSTVNDTTVRRRMVEIAADPAKGPDDTTFTGILSDETQQARVRLLEELGRYSAGLGELASASSEGDVDKAATKVHGSLKTIAGTYGKTFGKKVPGGDNTVAALAAAVDGVGRIVIAHKSSEAIRDIVTKADPAVQTTALFLSREFGTFTPYIRASMDVATVEMIKAYGREAPELSFSERLRRLEEIRSHQEQSELASLVFDNMAVAAANIGHSHAALLSAVREEKGGRENLVTHIRDLGEQASAIGGFYRQISRKQEKQ